MRKGLPLSDGSVSAVYSEHFLDHLPFEVVRNVIVPECYRLLEPGGHFRVGVTDGEFIAENYLATRKNLRPDELFTEIRQARSQDTQVPEFDQLDRDDPWRMKFTLYIEGRR